MAVSINFLILMPMVIPFLAAILIFGFRKWIKGFVGEIAVGLIIVLVAIIAALISRVNEATDKIIYGVYNSTQGTNYGPPTGVQFRADGFSSWFLLFYTIIVIFILVYETVNSRDKPEAPVYFSLLLFLVTGINGVLLSYDFFTMFLSWIVIGISLITLISFKRGGAELKEGGVRAYIMIGLGVALLLLAMVLCYGLFGTLNFDFVKNHPELLSLEKRVRLKEIFYLVIVLTVCGFGIMAHLSFMNLWMPKTIEKAPTSAKVFITGIANCAAVISIFRVLYSFFNPENFSWLNYPIILAVIGLITAFEGALLVINQILKKEGEAISLTKIITYSAIANIGIILVGMSIGGVVSDDSPETMIAIRNCIGYSVLLMINLAASLFICFFTSEKISKSLNNSDNLREMKGIAPQLPLTTLTLVIGLLSLGGSLPTFGGVVITMLLVSFTEAGYLLFAILLAIVILMLLLSYFWMIKLLLFDKPPRDLRLGRGRIGEAISLSTISGIILAFALLVVGIVPNIIAKGIIEGVLAIIP